MRWVVGLSGAYAALCLAAFLLVPASLHGWFGIASDPLAAIWAILLAPPWSLALHHVDGAGAGAGILIVLGGMVANFVLILLVGRWICQRRA